MTEPASEQPNPLIAFWLRPISTLRHVLVHCPDKHVSVLLALGGVVRVVNRLLSAGQVNQLFGPDSNGLPFAIGALSGWLTLYVYAWGLSITGDWLGGQATTDTCKTVVAWALLPSIATLLLLGPEKLLFDQHLLGFPTWAHWLETFLLLARLGCTAWSVITLVNGIRLAQQFGLVRAVVNVLLPGVTVLLFIGLVSGLYELLLKVTT